MKIDISLPAIKIYEDGSCRVIAEEELRASIEEVLCGAMERDVLVDTRGRVFRLHYRGIPDLVCAEILGCAPPLEVTENYTPEAVEELLATARQSRDKEVAGFLRALDLRRNATW